MFSYEFDPVKGAAVPQVGVEDRPAAQPVKQVQQRLLAATFDLICTEKRTKLEWKWKGFLSVNSKMKCTKEPVVKWELAITKIFVYAI